MKKILLLVAAAAFFVSSSSQALNLLHLVDKSYKCKKNDKACKNRAHLMAVAKVAVIAVAAKYITDMIIENHSKKIADEQGVVEEYKSAHKNLPEQPIASVYTTSTMPGSVVQPGKKILIQSDIVVVPGSGQKETLIEERLTIFDNEDNSKELKSLTKVVNEGTKSAGHYSNEFSFTLPEGLPQGIYPIKTALLLNGNISKTSSNDIQLVLQIDSFGQKNLVASTH